MKTKTIKNCLTRLNLFKDCFNGTKNIANKTQINQIITNRTHSYQIYLSR